MKEFVCLTLRSIQKKFSIVPDTRGFLNLTHVIKLETKLSLYSESWHHKPTQVNQFQN